MKLLADSTLPNLDALFLPAFTLTRYHSENDLPALLPHHDLLLCRSTLKVTQGLLEGSAIQCVATASSGIDHIDSHYLKNQGIPVFDAQGCNARAVADYVVSTLAYLSQHHRVLGHKAGVIGVGEVGSRVVSRLKAAGFDVICYDPLKAELDHHNPYCSLPELATCDLLCIHANLHSTAPYPSAHLFTAEFLAQLKPGVCIINAARGGIVDEAALLATNNSISYCTDVYSGEPMINAQLVDFSTLCTPHIAGHSIEAKADAVFKISQDLHQYYGLTRPAARPLSKNKEQLPTHANASTTWEEVALSLYNPIKDTVLLKTATNKSQAFLSQRQAHQHRHHFTFYDISSLDQKSQHLMGK